MNEMLDHLKNRLDSTPIKEVKKEWVEVEAMNLSGPSAYVYLNQVNSTTDLETEIIGGIPLNSIINARISYYIDIEDNCINQTSDFINNVHDALEHAKTLKLLYSSEPTLYKAIVVYGENELDIIAKEIIKIN